MRYYDLCSTLVRCVQQTEIVCTADSLVLLGIASLEAAEVAHGSLLSTDSELLGPSGLVPLVVDLGYPSGTLSSDLPVL